MLKARRPHVETPARSGGRYQCRIALQMVPPAPYEDAIKWAKADMLAMLGFDRLNLPYTGHDPVSGQRRYLKIIVTPDDMKTIRVAVIHALGLDRLTGHL